jgi:hypothetical protein
MAAVSAVKPRHCPAQALAVNATKTEEKNMTKFISYTAIVIGLSASATLAISPRTAKPDTTAEASFAADGAFRDGLFLGRQSAENGQAPRPAIGRWSTEHDRSMFTAGYRRGYGESLTGASSER